MTKQTQYQTIYFEENNSVLEISWHRTQNLTDAEYRQEMLWQAKFVNRYCPEKILIDSQEFEFVIVPETQKWVNAILPDSEKIGVKKIAFLISNHLFSQVSIEQQMEDYHLNLHQVLYFEDYEQAKKWLLS